MDTLSNWWVYILQCSDGTFYTGISNNLNRRLNSHNAGKGAKYTKMRRPVVLVYCEEATGRSEASKREYAMKKLTRNQKQTLLKVNDLVG